MDEGNGDSSMFELLGPRAHFMQGAASRRRLRSDDQSVSGMELRLSQVFFLAGISQQHQSAHKP